MSDFFNPYERVAQHGAHLPHWQQGEVFVFVTWRLADSLPESQLVEWASEKEIWMKLHPQPWDEITRLAYRERFPERIDYWLDQGQGSCVLARDSIRKVVVESLRFFEGERYEIAAFVVMPNHVHLLFRPIVGYLVADIVHSWRSFTGNEANRILGRKQTLWSAGYWDRLIRDREHFLRTVRYIKNNPVKAKLTEGKASLFVNQPMIEQVSRF
jgi:type I restriction enzyme R subunit